MSTTPFVHPLVATRAQQVQRGWTTAERRFRAVEGRRRRNLFLRLALPDAVVPAVWAAGSLTESDLQRLAS
jgi:hypothetical protein